MADYLHGSDPKYLLNLFNALVRRVARLELGNVRFTNINQVLPGVDPTILAPVADNWKNVFIFDDFIESSLIWNWLSDNSVALMTADPSYITTWPEHPGVMKMLGDVSHNFISISGAGISTNYILLPNSFDLIQFIVRCDTPIAAGDGYIIGVSALVAGALVIDGTSDGVYFKHAYGDTNWLAITRDGSGKTETDTGVAFAEAWLLLEIKRTGTDIFEFYINQTLVATHMTNITTTPISPIIGVMATGTAFSIYIDYFAMSLLQITQRWD